MKKILAFIFLLSFVSEAQLVRRILAGTNITITPYNGYGYVTINASGTPFKWNLTGQSQLQDSIRFIPGFGILYTRSGNALTATIDTSAILMPWELGDYATVFSLGSYPLTSTLRQGAYLSDTTKFPLTSTVLKNADSTTMKVSLLKNADSTTARTYSDNKYASLSAVLKNADSTTQRTYSDNKYATLAAVLKNADSTSQRTYTNNQLALKANSADVLKNADSTSQRNYTNNQLALKQATISNLADTSKYAKKTDTLGYIMPWELGAYSLIAGSSSLTTNSKGTMGTMSILDSVIFKGNIAATYLATASAKSGAYFDTARFVCDTVAFTTTGIRLAKYIAGMKSTGRIVWTARSAGEPTAPIAADGVGIQCKTDSAVFKRAASGTSGLKGTIFGFKY